VADATVEYYRARVQRAGDRTKNPMRPSKQVALAASAISILTSTLGHADTVVQIPIDALANARPVSTVSGGTVTIWSPGQGVDGGDGFVTTSVMTLFVTAHPTFFGAGNPMGGALPDDGSFPANDKWIHLPRENHQFADRHHGHALRVGFLSVEHGFLVWQCSLSAVWLTRFFE